MQIRETDKEPILPSVVRRLYQILNYRLIPSTALRLHSIKSRFHSLITEFQEFNTFVKFCLHSE